MTTALDLTKGYKAFNDAYHGLIQGVEVAETPRYEYVIAVDGDAPEGSVERRFNARIYDVTYGDGTKIGVVVHRNALYPENDPEVGWLAPVVRLY